jgi:hypothetical protein
LGERLFPETVVLTVEWCHLLFAVCSVTPSTAGGHRDIYW